MNLVSLLQQSVRAHGDKDCLRYKRGGAYVPITYGQFWQTVLACSAGLRRLGIRKGDKVAILANNCPQWAISDFAILSVGAVVVPIYPTLPADQVAFIVRNADVRLCIAENVQQYEKLRAAIPPLLEAAILIHPTNAPSPAATGLPWHAFNDLLNLGTARRPRPNSRWTSIPMIWQPSCTHRGPRGSRRASC
ncbi:hypothetical protein GCM10025857_13960 [Alicyclobacillus contaminans]|uniref:AMP-binding protein n=1 Tax=Alicyclobacillus contaminans TaxID=392016 RepID=UPI0003F8BB9E|nr:AMP-binding protein [Alicyclobacillus contaminans]GMA50039.1 hypothetical protein GCM10025857_13960 [Alicyclobacillus contaminans]